MVTFAGREQSALGWDVVVMDLNFHVLFLEPSRSQDMIIGIISGITICAIFFVGILILVLRKRKVSGEWEHGGSVMVHLPPGHTVPTESASPSLGVFCLVLFFPDKKFLIQETPSRPLLLCRCYLR